MSTTPAKPPSTPSSSTTTATTAIQQKDSKPIAILPGPFAQLYTHLHPILLLSLPYLGFPSLVQDPVQTLLAWAPVVAGLQGVYCVGCLPSSSASSNSGVKRKGKGKNSAGGIAGEVGGRVVQTLLSTLLTLTLCTPLLAIILILFGAPLTTHHSQTALLALHLSLLTTLPLFYTHGLDPATWRKILSLQLPVDDSFGMAVGACVGSWVGAVPIPLDWDREWQRWPVTVVVGGFVGAAVGKALGGSLLRGFKGRIS